MGSPFFVKAFLGSPDAEGWESLVYSNRNKNVVALSGTGVPPSLLDEVQERRSGACRGAGAAYRLVPVEIKHWLRPDLVLVHFSDFAVEYLCTSQLNI